MKKKKSRTNEWMDGKICYRVSSSLVGKCAIGVSCGFMARQPTRPQTGNSTWEITRYHLAQLILIKKRSYFLERNTTTLRCQQQRVQLFRFDQFSLPTYPMKISFEERISSFFRRINSMKHALSLIASKIPFQNILTDFPYLIHPGLHGISYL